MAEEYIVRRLTPLECNRLQGFPDKWGEIDPKEDFTEEEYQFWLKVRNDYAEINGKQTKEYTKEQMLTWYNKLHTDAAEYKMWGNGLALPNALYVMQGIVGRKRMRVEYEHKGYRYVWSDGGDTELDMGSSWVYDPFGNLMLRTTTIGGPPTKQDAIKSIEATIKICEGIVKKLDEKLMKGE